MTHGLGSNPGPASFFPSEKQKSLFYRTSYVKHELREVVCAECLKRRWTCSNIR